MSQIIDLIPNLQKIFRCIKEINASIKDNKLKLEVEPNEIFNAIENFNKEKSGNIEKIKSNKDDIESLKSKTFQLNQETPKLESEVKELSQKKTEVQNKLTKKRKELEEIQAKNVKCNEKFDNNSQIFEGLERELNDSWKKVKEKIQEISKVDNKINQEIDGLKEGYNQILNKKQGELNNKIKKIDAENEEEYNKRLDEFNLVKIKTKAVDLLIRNGMLNLEVLKFISALEKDKPIDLNFICQTINYDPQKAEKIIKQMVAEGGPITFNEKNGLITLYKGVEFKR